MEKINMAMLVAVMAFGLVFASCDDGSGGGGQDPRLNGRWQARYYDVEEFSFNFGSFGYTTFPNSTRGFEFLRGTYTTSEDSIITITVTGLYHPSGGKYSQTPGWKNRSQIVEYLKQRGSPDWLIEEELQGLGFNSFSGTYAMFGDYGLGLVFDYTYPFETGSYNLSRKL